MAKKEWGPEREAELIARAERGFEPHELGPPVPNPLRKAGRPSLSAGGGTSKALDTRIPSDLFGELRAIAGESGRSLSDLIREALTAYVAEARGRAS